MVQNVSMPCNHKDIWQAVIGEYVSYVSPKAHSGVISFDINKSTKSIFINYFNNITLNCKFCTHQCERDIWRLKFGREAEAITDTCKETIKASH